MQGLGEGQHADDEDQGWPVNGAVGAVQVNAAKSAHQQAADQCGEHVGHQAADHQGHHHRQAEQGVRCLARRRCHLVDFCRQAEHEEIAALLLQAVNSLPATGDQQGVAGLEAFIDQHALQRLAVAAQPDHVELVARAEAQLLDGFAG